MCVAWLMSIQEADVGWEHSVVSCGRKERWRSEKGQKLYPGSLAAVPRVAKILPRRLFKSVTYPVVLAHLQRTFISQSLPVDSWTPRTKHSHVWGGWAGKLRPGFWVIWRISLAPFYGTMCGNPGRASGSQQGAKNTELEHGSVGRWESGMGRLQLEFQARHPHALVLDSFCNKNERRWGDSRFTLFQPWGILPLVLFLKSIMDPETSLKSLWPSAIFNLY